MGRASCEGGLDTEFRGSCKDCGGMKMLLRSTKTTSKMREEGQLDNGWPTEAHKAQSTAHDGKIIMHLGNEIPHQRRCYLRKRGCVSS